MSLEQLPNLQLIIGKSPAVAEIASHLRAVKVRQALSVPALCVLEFSGARADLETIQGLVPGETIKLLVGADTIELFSGEVTALEHVYGSANETIVRLRAYDMLHRMRKTQSVRQFDNVTAADLVQQVAHAHGVTVKETIPGARLPHVMQWRQSDLEIIRQVSADNGLHFVYRDEALHMMTLVGISDTPAVELTLGSDLIEMTVTSNTEPACRTVTTTGWNPQKATAQKGSAADARTAAPLCTATSPQSVGASGERFIANRAVHSDDEASALAQLWLDSRAASEVTVRGTADGNARISPGTTLTIEGLSATLSGPQLVTVAEHTIDRDEGFRSSFDTTPPAPEAPKRGTLTTLGVVSNVDDPLSIARVRVRLAAYQDIETDWLEVVMPAAGPQKGLTALPDVDDRVLVLLADEDPCRGVVLGGLYGEGGPHDPGVVDRSVQRYTMRTPGDQSLQMDDEDRKIRLRQSSGARVELSPRRAYVGDAHGSHLQIKRDGLRLEAVESGSYVEFDNDRMTLHSETDLLIEAPGRNVTVRAASVDFESG